MKKSRETLLQELLLSKSDAINTIQKYRKEVEKRLEILEKQSIKQVEKKFGEIEIILIQEKSKVENEENDLKRDAGSIKELDWNRAQQFVYMKTAQKKIAETENVLRSLNARKDATVSFAGNPDIRIFLHQIQTLGSVISHHNATAVSKESKYTIKGRKNLNIKTSKDVLTCDLRGACFTDNGLLLLADFINQKLKRVDLAKPTVLEPCDLPGGPNGVCCTGKQEAAVTLNNRTIQFVKLKNRMSCTRKIKLDHAAFGIAYKEDRLYVTNNSNSLYVHDMTGNLLQTVSKDSSDNSSFRNCWHLAFIEDTETLYVTTWHGLVKLNAQGQHVKTYKDTEMTNVVGVCTDRRGNLFASAYVSNKITQIEQGGMKSLAWSLEVLME